jgi:hypothetical protein
VAWLNSVSCTSDASCLAVGGSNLGSVNPPLVESWNGSSWSAVPSPSGFRGQLNAISCTSATNCVAVGEQASSRRWQTLVESSDASGCRLPATWDHPAADFASGMGPPPLPVMGPPLSIHHLRPKTRSAGPPREARWHSGRYRWSRSGRRSGAG